jgi:hypothetical protein
LCDLQRRSVTSHRVHRTRNKNLGYRVQRTNETLPDARVQRVQSFVPPVSRKLWLQREQHTAIRGYFQFS